MHNIVKGIILTSFLLFVGCATVPKQPKTFNQLGQYQQIPLNASTYRISFRATSDLSYGNAEEIALLKSAQVTVQQGFDSFKVLDDPSNQINQKQPRQAVVYPDRYYYPFAYRPYSPFGYRPYGYGYSPYYWDDPFFDMPYVVNVDPVEISYTIEMFKQEVAPGDAFDAHRILKALGAKYGLREDGTVIVPTPPAVADNNKTP